MEAEIYEGNNELALYSNLLQSRMTLDDTHPIFASLVKSIQILYAPKVCP